MQGVLPRNIRELIASYDQERAHEETCSLPTNLSAPRRLVASLASPIEPLSSGGPMVGGQLTSSLGGRSAIEWLTSNPSWSEAGLIQQRPDLLTTWGCGSRAPISIKDKD